jgi:hypothetical protein
MSAPWEKYQTESDGPWNNYAEGGGPWSSYADEIIAPSPVKTAEKSFLGGVAEAAGKRLSKTGEILSNLTGEEGGAYGFFKNAPAKAIQVAGQGAGFINDLVGQGISAGYRNLVPESAQKAISEGMSGMMANPTVKSTISGISEGYGALKERYPEGVATLEAGANIAGAIPVAMLGKSAYQGAKAVGKESAALFRDIGALTAGPQADAIADTMVKDIVRKGIEKGVRPTVAGKGTAGAIRQYYDKATEAVKTIVHNKNEIKLMNADGEIVQGALPQSLNQFSEAIDQTKKTIFKQYDAMAAQAGATGATVDLAPIATELNKISMAPVIKDLSPEVSAYAQKVASNLKQRGAYTAEQAQEAIANLNKSLEAFYRNPSYDNASKAGIDAMIVNNLRKELDNVITSASGEGYQELKRSYGALKAVEKEVTHRAIVDARKNVKGLIDFTDIFTSGDLVQGLATMNPAMLGRGVFTRAVKEVYKTMNDPNRIVRNMFRDVDNLVAKRGQPLQSRTMQSIYGNRP